MTANVLPTIFTIEIGDTPTLTFEAQNLREAHELCHEQWLKDDLAEAKSDGAPLWDGKAKLRARMARPDESALFAEANKNGQPADHFCWLRQTGRSRRAAPSALVAWPSHPTTGHHRTLPLPGRPSAIARGIAHAPREDSELRTSASACHRSLL